VCYTMRLTRTAERAKALGFDAFSTTLLASTRQDVGLIRAVAAGVSKNTGVALLDEDWPGAHERGQELARRMSLYRQQYCGCVYSEYDRYKDSKS
jgi:predicted adenine nucleotide alpha hydrolase (AANH) superfamily ATPase